MIIISVRAYVQQTTDETVQYCTRAVPTSANEQVKFIRLLRQKTVRVFRGGEWVFLFYPCNIRFGREDDILFRRHASSRLPTPLFSPHAIIHPQPLTHTYRCLGLFNE